MMLKLYKLDTIPKVYWETWDNEDGSYTIHWGNLGEKGETKIIKPSLIKSASRKVKLESEERIKEGFQPFDDLEVLLIEYKIEGFGTSEDLDKRHELEERMNETLGWTGLGHMDGGSIGSGTMEVCTFVVDTEIAKNIIAADLKGTKFADYTRIYTEG